MYLADIVHGTNCIIIGKVYYITHTKIVPETFICYIPNHFMIMK